MKKAILFQLDMAWQLFEYHCIELGESEAMWCKSKNGLQVRRNGDKWSVDWPSTEDYNIGPSSIAWTMWHILFWWNTTLIASKENRIIEKEDIKWPGNIEAAGAAGPVPDRPGGGHWTEQKHHRRDGARRVRLRHQQAHLCVRGAAGVTQRPPPGQAEPERHPEQRHAEAAGPA